MRCPIAGPGRSRRWKPTCSGSKVAGTSMKPGSNLKGQGWPHRGRNTALLGYSWQIQQSLKFWDWHMPCVSYGIHMDIRYLPKLQWYEALESLGRPAGRSSPSGYISVETSQDATPGRRPWWSHGPPSFRMWVSKLAKCRKIFNPEGRMVVTLW